MKPRGTIVLKFGGTSVGTPERLRRAATLVARYRQRYKNVLVVVSAMGETTDQLIDLARRVFPHANRTDHRREMDMLLTSGERVSMALLSLALAQKKVHAVSFTGSQSGILTNTHHGDAEIMDIRPIRILESFKKGRVVIVAGFQGVSPVTKEVTTLGRGGSDTSAVALGVALRADKTVIFTDVPGFFSADPRCVPSAHRYSRVPADIALVAAYAGAQVLHSRCLELAMKFDHEVEVRSAFHPQRFTQIEVRKGKTSMEALSLESPRVWTVALQKDVMIARFPRLKKRELSRELNLLGRQGVKWFHWAYADEELKLILSEDQDERILRRSGARLQKGCSRLTLVGVGLAQSSRFLEELKKTLDAQRCSVLEMDAQTLGVSILMKKSSREKALVQKLHRVFVSK